MSKKELDRLQQWRLGIIHHAQEVTHNVAKTCRYYGISRSAFYKWLERYEKEGIEGLKDKSRRPHNSPRATKMEVVAKIIYLRENYHFGPYKIQMYLKRYHDIDLSKSGIWRILKRLKINLLPSSCRYRKHKERWKRKGTKNLSLDIDFKLMLNS